MEKDTQKGTLLLNCADRRQLCKMLSSNQMLMVRFKTGKGRQWKTTPKEKGKQLNETDSTALAKEPIQLKRYSNKIQHHFETSQQEREREMFYLTTHSTHFIYGYMASDIWLRTILIVRKETHCRHIGYSYRLAARVLLYAPSHRQDNTYHGLCYTSRGALAGTRNSSTSQQRIWTREPHAGMSSSSDSRWVGVRDVAQR